MAKLTNKDKRRMQKYAECEPKQLGTLHQRMKYAMEIVERMNLESINRPDGHDLVTALYDLQTEVGYHEPAKPPYGRRTLEPR